MARGSRSVSDNRRCGWIASPSEAREHERGRLIGGEAAAKLALLARADRGNRAGGLRGQGCAGRTVLRPVGINGADAADRRRIAGIEISVWIQLGILADSYFLPADRTDFRCAAEARRRRSVPLARRYFAGLGQAGRRPARRSYPDADRTALDQRQGCYSQG